jgi:hypothetical protein
MKITVTKRTALYVLSFFFAAFFFASCKKESIKKNENGQVLVQGNITLKVRVMHHWWGVSYLPVYLKKGATTWPGPDSTLYEFHVNADNEGNCEFTHLFPGNYYLYAHGYDSFFGLYVIGYDSVHLSNSATTGNEHSYTLLVSE